MTLEDVAREAGVSQTTVSYVLSGSKHASRISDATRARIVEAAQRLGYSRNSIGAALQRGYSDLTVLLAVGWNLAIGHSAETMAITRAAASRGLATIVDVASDDMDAVRVLRRVSSLNPYGLFLMWDAVSHPEEDLTRLQDMDIPIVHLMPTGIASIPTVTADREAGTALAARRLIDLGHTRIGMLVGPEPHKLTALPKMQGYLRALKHSGISEDAELFENLSSGLESEFDAGYEAFMRLYQRRPDVTAIMCVGDLPALGAIAAAQDLGLSVPQDLSVIGHGGSPDAQNFRPKLSTVAAQPALVAERAAGLMVALRTNVPEAASVLLPMELIERDSMGPVRRM